MEKNEAWETVTIKVNGLKVEVPARTTAMEVLKQLGYRFSPLPEKDTIHAPCMVGGCWSCAVLIDGELRPSCITPVREAMNIETEISGGVEPLRLVHGFMGHTVGEVGTPWWLKGLSRYIEAACFACGCNLRCPQCQNWTIIYCGKEETTRPGMALKP